MKLVYIAGAYRGATPYETEQNIRRAEREGLEAAQLGTMPVIPHTMTRYFDGTVTHEFWLAGTLELMRRCDALLIAPGWENSAGTQAEIKEAHRLNIPVFYSQRGLADWLRWLHAIEALSANVSENVAAKNSSGT